mmetsp:Transcript_33695/g.41543  ORF Transcript_33695/g.41543 Transcript_33695/m.41543 type:complete len:101 (+) Transcript_33695:44-346(+)
MIAGQETVVVCEGGSHVHMANLCMNCQMETICRNCKIIDGDQHICKLCSISFAFETGPRSSTFFFDPRPEDFVKEASVTRCRETGLLKGFDKIAELLDIE